MKSIGLFWSCALVLGITVSSIHAREGQKAEAISWCAGYTQAVACAEKEGKMLFLYFRGQADDAMVATFETDALGDPAVVAGLKRFVCVRVTLDDTIRVDGQSVKLIEHPAFDEMLDRPGVAIVDFAHRDAAYYGDVVSAFPLMSSHPYTPERMAAILDLPAGTMTQRTLVYAVRVHPEHPASTTGALHASLVTEAESHSQYQASIRRQGHHFWDMRFRRIGSMLPGITPKEVCAESWPGQRLLEAAIECVRCWRTSSGHWNAVRSSHPVWGYDMKRGANGTWYATGIFGDGRLLDGES